MHYRKKYLVLGLFLAALTMLISGCEAPAGNAADGKRWFMMHNCYSCHGPNGNDGKAPAIDTQHIGFRSFLGSVRNANSPIMPKFPEEKISKQDVADMYAWLQTR